MTIGSAVPSIRPPPPRQPGKRAGPRRNRRPGRRQGDTEAHQPPVSPQIVEPRRPPIGPRGQSGVPEHRNASIHFRKNRTPRRRVARGSTAAGARGAGLRLPDRAGAPPRRARGRRHRPLPRRARRTPLQRRRSERPRDGQRSDPRHRGGLRGWEDAASNIDSPVTSELASAGYRTLPLVTRQRLPAPLHARRAAGWHAHQSSSVSGFSTLRRAAHRSERQAAPRPPPPARSAPPR
jgi:hypothetical protein